MKLRGVIEVEIDLVGDELALIAPGGVIAVEALFDTFSWGELADFVKAETWEVTP